jgi:uncharacterized protein YoxC
MHRVIFILALLSSASAGQHLAVRFDYGKDIEQRSANKPKSCEAVVSDHFTSLVSTTGVGSSDIEAHNARFDRGIKMAWICSTVSVKRPCGPMGIVYCDKSSCFKSLSNGNERDCLFTDDDHIGFKVVEASVLQRFQTELATRQLAIAENTRALVEDVGTRVDHVGFRVDYVGSAVQDVGLRVDYVGSAVQDVGLRVDYVGSAVQDVGLRVDYVGSAVHAVSAKADGILDLQDKQLEIIGNVNSAVQDVSAKADGILDMQDKQFQLVQDVGLRVDYVGSAVDAVSAKTSEVLALQDTLAEVQKRLSLTQDQMGDRLAVLLDCVQRVGGVMEFVVSSIDIVDRRVAFVSSLITNFISDVVSTFVDAYTIYNTRDASGIAGILASLAFYWLVFRYYDFGQIPCCVVYCSIVRIAIKRAVCAATGSIFRKHVRVDETFALALSAPLPEEKEKSERSAGCNAPTRKGSNCKNPSKCARCGHCRVHCKCA